MPLKRGPCRPGPSSRLHERESAPLHLPCPPRVRGAVARPAAHWSVRDRVSRGASYSRTYVGMSCWCLRPHPHPCSSLVTGTLEAFNPHPLKWAAFLTVIQEDGPGASWPPADSPGPWGCCGNVRNGDGSKSGASGRGGGRSAPPPRGCHARGTGTRSGHAPDSSWQRAWGASRDRETPAGPRCRHEAVCLPGGAGLAGAGAEGR